MKKILRDIYDKIYEFTSGIKYDTDFINHIPILNNIELTRGFWVKLGEMIINENNSISTKGEKEMCDSKIDFLGDNISLIFNCETLRKYNKFRKWLCDSEFVTSNTFVLLAFFVSLAISIGISMFLIRLRLRTSIRVKSFN